MTGAASGNKDKCKGHDRGGIGDGGVPAHCSDRTQYSALLEICEDVDLIYRWLSPPGNANKCCLTASSNRITRNDNRTYGLSQSGGTCSRPDISAVEMTVSSKVKPQRPAERGPLNPASSVKTERPGSARVCDREVPSDITVHQVRPTNLSVNTAQGDRCESPASVGILQREELVPRPCLGRNFVTPPPPPSPPPPPPPPVQPVLSLPKPQSSAPIATKKRTIRWEKIPLSSVSPGASNIWTTNCESISFEDDVTKTLEAKFQLPSATVASHRPQLNEAKQVSPLNLRRAMAIDIAFRRLGMSPEEFVRCLHEGNIEPFGSDGFDILAAVLPTDQEIADVTSWARNLTTTHQRQPGAGNSSPAPPLALPERLCCALGKLPHARRHIAALRLINDWPIKLAALEKPTIAFSTACESVLANQKFTTFLHVLLRLGNLVNNGSREGNAAGFRLRNISRVLDTRTTDGQSTFLEVVVRTIMRYQPALLDFEQELHGLRSASRIDINAITNSFEELKDGLFAILKALERQELSQLTGHMSTFLQLAYEDVKRLHARINAMNDARRRLAVWLCENPDGFNAAECLRLIVELCINVERIRVAVPTT